MIDLDVIELELTCPRCGFVNDFKFRQARLRDVIICRGCHGNIQLDDQLNTCRKARTAVRRAMQELQESLKSLTGTIRIRI